MELGQMLLSNTDWHQYECNWAQDGLSLIAEVIAEIRGKSHDRYGWDGLLTNNSGGEEYVNDVFEMRSYCWCDPMFDDNSMHPNGCPPNFLYKPTGLVITWYKHAGRSATSNKKYPGARTWFEIVKHCVGSIE